MADPKDSQTLVNQVILAKQLIKAGADVTARAESGMINITPLHNTCYSGNVTNLELTRLILLESGAGINLQNSKGGTPLMCTVPHAMEAAKLLLQHLEIDANVALNDGSTVPGCLRESVAEITFIFLVHQQPHGLAPSWISYAR